MKTGIMSLIGILLTCQSMAEVPAGSYYGYQHLENRVFSRIIKPSRQEDWGLSFFLTSYVARGTRVYGLDRLLGHYEDGRFQNGDPNALNWTFASLVFKKLSQALADSCTTWSGTREYFQHNTIETLEAVCAEAENGSVIADETLLDFWILLMGYDASFEEFESWLAFANSEPVRSLPTKQRVTSIANTIFLNPYFLIRN